MSSITIPLETYECLRGHLEKANEIFNSLGMVGSLASERKTPKPLPKETKEQKVDKYKKLIGSGQRGTKPKNLIKSGNRK